MGLEYMCTCDRGAGRYSVHNHFINYTYASDPLETGKSKYDIKCTCTSLPFSLIKDNFYQPYCMARMGDGTMYVFDFNVPSEVFNPLDSPKCTAYMVRSLGDVSLSRRFPCTLHASDDASLNDMSRLPTRLTE